MSQRTVAQVGLIGAVRPAPHHRSVSLAASRSLQWIPDQARRLAVSNTARGESWSLAEVCEHLALAFESTVRGQLDEGTPPRWTALSRLERGKRWCIKQFMLATGWFPRGVPAPASVAPSDSVSLNDALAHLENAAAAFDRRFSSAGSTWGYHSLLGKMSARAWRRFHAIHAAHHFSFFTLESAS